MRRRGALCKQCPSKPINKNTLNSAEFTNISVTSGLCKLVFINLKAENQRAVRSEVEKQ